MKGSNGRGRWAVPGGMALALAVLVAACGSPPPPATSEPPPATAPPPAQSPEAVATSTRSPEASTTAPTAGPTAAPACTVRDTDSLRLRGGPGTVYPILGAMERGAVFAPIAWAEGGGWIFGRFGTQSGWASANFLDCSLEPASLPIATAPPTPTPAPFGNEDPLPGGVDAQLSLGGALYVAPGGFCGLSLGDGGPPASQLVVPGEVAIGDRSVVCIGGFSPGAATLELLLPNGRRATSEVLVGEDGFGPWPWTLLPGAQLGAYRLRVAQGTVSASADTQVVPATRAVVVVDPLEGRPGDAFTIGAAGFDPGSAIGLYLYERTPAARCTPTPDAPAANCARFRSVLFQGRADARGEVRLVLPSTPDLPPGFYPVIGIGTRGGERVTVPFLIGLSASNITLR